MAKLAFSISGPTMDLNVAFEVADADTPRILGYLMAHPDYGFIVETKTVEVQEGVDADGKPIMASREVTTRNPATPAEASEAFAHAVLRDLLTKADAAALAHAEAAEVAKVREKFKPTEATPV